MVDIPAGIAAEAAIAKQAAALSIIKKNAEAQQAIANILQNAVTSVPTSSLGSNVNIKV